MTEPTTSAVAVVMPNRLSSPRSSSAPAGASGPGEPVGCTTSTGRSMIVIAHLLCRAPAPSGRLLRQASSARDAGSTALTRAVPTTPHVRSPAGATAYFPRAGDGLGRMTAGADAAMLQPDHGQQDSGKGQAMSAVQDPPETTTEAGTATEAQTSAALADLRDEVRRQG